MSLHQGHLSGVLRFIVTQRSACATANRQECHDFWARRQNISRFEKISVDWVN
jgi:hypothetical protein